MRNRILALCLTLLFLLPTAACSGGEGGGETPASLESLISSIPESYEQILSEEGAKEVSSLIGEIQSKGGSMTSAQASSYYESLKEITESPKYVFGDIDAIYLNYPVAPVKNGDYVSASIAVVDVDRGLSATLEDKNAQCKVRGNTTADFAKTPYNIKFSQKQSVLGMEAGKTWCLLANAFDKSLMRNAVALSFADSIGVKGVSDYRYVDLFVNGTYMGNYMITQKVNGDRVGIDPQKGDYLLEIAQPIYKVEKDVTYVEASTPEVRFEINEPDPISAAQKNALQTIIDRADAAIASGNQAEIGKYVDLESFVNFYIAHEYLKMLDFHYSSPRFYIKNGTIYAGPVWDFDLSMGNANIGFEPYTPYMNGGGLGQSYQGLWVNRTFGWYKNLMNQSWFKKLVAARYKAVQPQIVNLYADNNLGKNLIDTLYADYSASFNRNFNEAGWRFDQKSAFEDPDPAPTYEGNMEWLREWLQRRNEWLSAEFATY